jgi:fatty acid/phospholipid biosynthesis enzyme
VILRIPRITLEEQKKVSLDVIILDPFGSRIFLKGKDGAAVVLMQEIKKKTITVIKRALNSKNDLGPIGPL